MGGGCERGSTAELEGCFGDAFALDDTERAEAIRVVGKPGYLVARAKLDALPLFSRWRDTIAAHLDAAEHEHDAGRFLADAGRELADDEAVVASIFEARMMARMAGGLFVRAIEVPESLGAVDEQDLARQVLPASRRVLRDGRPSFLQLAFREAVELFLRRQIVTPEAFAAMADAERLVSFTATRLASELLIERARELVQAHLEEGGDLRSFVRGLRDAERATGLGIEPASPWYLETVYRTNVQMAYGQGRLEQLEAPAVVQARPFVQYRTAGDNRVRAEHAALRGLVFDRSQDNGWRRYAPPLGYNCRCSLVTVREGRFDPSQVVHSSDLDARDDVGAPDGWTGPGSA